MKTIRGGIRGVIEVSQTLQSFFRGLDEAENKKRNSEAWKNFTPADAEPLSVLLLPALLPACVCCARVTVVGVVVVTCNVACLSLRRVRWMFRTRRFVGCYLRCHLGC